MLYLLLKINNPDTRIFVSNLKYEIDKSNLAKFGNNVKYLLDGIYYYYTIIINEGERHGFYIHHIFRDLFSGTRSTLIHLIQIKNVDCETGT